MDTYWYNALLLSGFGLWQEKDRAIKRLKKELQELEVHDACVLKSHNEAHWTKHAKTIYHVVTSVRVPIHTLIAL